MGIKDMVHGIRNRLHIGDMLIYIVFIALMVCLVGTQKVNWHLDEVFSYGLSNYTGEGIVLPVEDGKTYYPSHQVWSDYMSVDEGERFHYGNVWKKQGEDVHPPLYYAALHTVCSLFPGSISMWFGAAVNIVFACGILFFFRKIVLLLTCDRRMQMAASTVLIFSACILSLVTFMRMYIMAMFWVIALTYEVAKLIGGGYFRVRDYLPVLFCTVCGALTHYYCIVYTVMLSVAYGCYLLYEKRWRETGLFCLMQAAAGIMAVIIFPSMIKHIFFGYRGTQRINNLKHSGLESLIRVWETWKVMDDELFGGLLIYVAGAALLSLCVCGYRKCHGEKIVADKTFLARYLCCFCACAMYFLIICLISSNSDTRYLSPVYGILLAVVVCGVAALCKGIVKQQYVRLAIVAVLAVLIIKGWQNQRWSYLYKSTQPLLETAASYADTDCVCIYSDSWRLNPVYEEVSKFHSATFYRSEDLDMLSLSDLASRYELIVVTDRYLDVRDQEVLDRIIHMCPDIDTYEEIGNDIYTVTYYLHPSVE